MAASALALVLLLAFSGHGIVGALTPPSNARAALFASAAHEFSVPAELLLAVSYNQSRWTPHGALPSNDNGFGIMNLRTKTVQAKEDGRGHMRPSAPKETVIEATHYSLDDAARLLGASTEEVKMNERQNVRGGAAALAEYARKYNGGVLPATLGDWYAAVAAYGGSTKADRAAAFADDVYATLETGATLTTPDNQSVALKAQTGVTANREGLTKLNLAPSSAQATDGLTDCPRTLNCRFIPAAYAANSEDPTDYGNWDPADRPNDLKIRYIIIHDTEGSYQSAIDWFLNPASYTSSHYVIRSSDGDITQMVRLKDVAWTAGNWYMNPHSINIEHEGFAAQGQVWYTEAMYRSSAELVRWIAQKYNIPLDRQHILGHDDIPRLNPARMIGAHWDPGPYWDWEHYMELLGAPDLPDKPVTDRTKVVTITPNFATNQPPIKQCVDGVCTDLPLQGANVVHLRTEPRTDAPLISNRYLHPDGSPGTNEIADWGATAVVGQEFALAEKRGDWTGIWYDGKIGWFYNPRGEGQTASASHSKVVTPKAGRTSIPVYAAAFPEADAYPSTIPVQAMHVHYEMPAGQFYTVQQSEASDYFYDATYNFSLPDDHMIVRGDDTFYRIAFNHRIGYVKKADVDIRYW